MDVTKIQHHAEVFMDKVRAPWESHKLTHEEYLEVLGVLVDLIEEEKIHVHDEMDREASR